jgi:hypothetical protein
VKAVVIKVQNNRAYLLLENGKFITVRRARDMKTGMQVYIGNGIVRRLTRVVNIAACFTAVAFAMVYLAYCLYILMFH